VKDVILRPQCVVRCKWAKEGLWQTSFFFFFFFLFFLSFFFFFFFFVVVVAVVVVANLLLGQLTSAERQMRTEYDVPGSI